MESMLNLKRAATSAAKTKAELVVVGIHQGIKLTPAASEVDRALKGALTKYLKKTRFTGAIRSATIIPTMGKIPASAVMAVGLGPADKIDHDAVRRGAGTAARAAGGFSSVALDISRGLEGGAQAAAEGFALGAYGFTRYKSDTKATTGRAVILGAAQADIDRAQIVCDATNWARDLVNEPPSNRGPAEFARLVAERAGQGNIKVEIFDEKAMARLGMNGILTVGKGSSSPPRFVVLTYNPKRAKGFVGLVGKGITFDSGGLSLKSNDGMTTMKMDCSGAAVVAGAISALPALDVKVKVVAALALAENMPSGNAVKLGDVIHHFGGRTSEVLNTDAEGRLVLADALAWMTAQKPDAMVNAATLTGGVVTALGSAVAGVMSNRSELVGELIEASKRTGERLWELPLIDEYRETIDSAVADIKNTSDTPKASAIFGGLFLRDFVGDTPWAHLDIAGTAWSEKAAHYLPQGATAFGTRLLIDWIASRSDGDRMA